MAAPHSSTAANRLTSKKEEEEKKTFKLCQLPCSLLRSRRREKPQLWSWLHRSIQKGNMRRKKKKAQTTVVWKVTQLRRASGSLLPCVFRRLPLCASPAHICFYNLKQEEPAALFRASTFRNFFFLPPSLSAVLVDIQQVFM